MSFQEPLILALLLLPIVALAVVYLVLQRRRRAYAVRFTNVELLKSVAPRRPGWRRHLPVALVGFALLLLALGLARPVHETLVADESRIVMLSIDVSRSMEATDVSPSRLEAAQDAASQFVQDLPEGVEVGLVSFSGSADLVVPPTAEKAKVQRAIRGLQPEDATASGDAIVTSLQAIEAARVSAGVDQTEETPPAAAIVLLSDGDQTVGVPLAEAAQDAADAGVPVNTITFGTEAGTVQFQGTTVPVPPNQEAMAEVAEISGGSTFDARSGSELRDVYSQLEGDVGYTLQESELWPWFAAGAFIVIVVACLGAFIWTGRFL